MDPVVLAAGTALVTAMTGDAWEAARGALVGLWRKGRPEESEAVGSELERARSVALESRRTTDTDTEQALVGFWRMRLDHLLRECPDLAGDLRTVVEKDLVPRLGAGERDRVTALFGQTEAHDHARIYQAGRDQHIDGE
ncbi:hypothetical protein [Streptomyces minutiscleroticus]|uniref:Uncharacterized protein n=1 Tax=Streptomyces minutiscleroticus TaxID=68238 RepID=A0A918NMN1_9ACTN|nr:hypothetical protein [Streptomyces minutiscleroticus]GGX81380.1 hypothetical protein GCM10010358_39670 [Streptomyces minutiscleroticus]